MSLTLSRQLFHFPTPKGKPSSSLTRSGSCIYVLSSSSYQTTRFNQTPSTVYDSSAPETIIFKKPATTIPILPQLPGLPDPLPTPEEVYIAPNVKAHAPAGYTPTRLLVIDILSILFRAHHGLSYNIEPHVRPVDGRVVSALHGFCNTLKRICLDVKPTHIIAAMDTPAARGKRRAISMDYKANRPPIPDSLSWQIEQVPALLEAMGIPVIVREEYEADDIIASVCQRVEMQLSAQGLIPARVRVFDPLEGVDEDMELPDPQGGGVAAYELPNGEAEKQLLESRPMHRVLDYGLTCDDLADGYYEEDVARRVDLVRSFIAAAYSEANAIARGERGHDAHESRGQWVGGKELGRLVDKAMKGDLSESFNRVAAAAKERVCEKYPLAEARDLLRSLTDGAAETTNPIHTASSASAETEADSAGVETEVLAQSNVDAEEDALGSVGAHAKASKRAPRATQGATQVGAAASPLDVAGVSAAAVDWRALSDAFDQVRQRLEQESVLVERAHLPVGADEEVAPVQTTAAESVNASPYADDPVATQATQTDVADSDGDVEPSEDADDNPAADAATPEGVIPPPSPNSLVGTYSQPQLLFPTPVDTVNAHTFTVLYGPERDKWPYSKRYNNGFTPAESSAFLLAAAGPDGVRPTRTLLDDANGRSRRVAGTRPLSEETLAQVQGVAAPPSDRGYAVVRPLALNPMSVAGVPCMSWPGTIEDSNGTYYQLYDRLTCEQCDEQYFTKYSAEAAEAVRRTEEQISTKKAELKEEKRAQRRAIALARAASRGTTANADTVDADEDADTAATSTVDDESDTEDVTAEPELKTYTFYAAGPFRRQRTPLRPTATAQLGLPDLDVPGMPVDPYRIGEPGYRYGLLRVGHISELTPRPLHTQQWAVHYSQRNGTATVADEKEEVAVQVDGTAIVANNFLSPISSRSWDMIGDREVWRVPNGALSVRVNTPMHYYPPLEGRSELRLHDTLVTRLHPRPLRHSPRRETAVLSAVKKAYRDFPHRQSDSPYFDDMQVQPFANLQSSIPTNSRTSVLSPQFQGHKNYWRQDGSVVSANLRVKWQGTPYSDASTAYTPSSKRLANAHEPGAPEHEGEEYVMVPAAYDNSARKTGHMPARSVGDPSDFNSLEFDLNDDASTSRRVSTAATARPNPAVRKLAAAQDDAFDLNDEAASVTPRKSSQVAAPAAADHEVSSHTTADPYMSSAYGSFGSSLAARTEFDADILDDAFAEADEQHHAQGDSRGRVAASPHFITRASSARQMVEHVYHGTLPLHVFVASADKDMLQLVGPHATLLKLGVPGATSKSKVAQRLTQRTPWQQLIKSAKGARAGKGSDVLAQTHTTRDDADCGDDGRVLACAHSSGWKTKDPLYADAKAPTANTTPTAKAAPAKITGYGYVRSVTSRTRTKPGSKPKGISRAAMRTDSQIKSLLNERSAILHQVNKTLDRYVATVGSTAAQEMDDLLGMGILRDDEQLDALERMLGAFGGESEWDDSDMDMLSAGPAVQPWAVGEAGLGQVDAQQNVQDALPNSSASESAGHGVGSAAMDWGALALRDQQVALDQVHFVRSLLDATAEDRAAAVAAAKAERAAEAKEKRALARAESERLKALSQEEREAEIRQKEQAQQQREAEREAKIAERVARDKEWEEKQAKYSERKEQWVQEKRAEEDAMLQIFENSLRESGTAEDVIAAAVVQERQRLRDEDMRAAAERRDQAYLRFHEARRGRAAERCLWTNSPVSAAREDTRLAMDRLLYAIDFQDTAAVTEAEAVLKNARRKQVEAVRKARAREVVANGDDVHPHVYGSVWSAARAGLWPSDKHFEHEEDDSFGYEDYDTLQFAPYCPERVRLELGISPAQMSEHLAVVGDTADNVTGIPGVGVVLSTQLFNRYGDLHNILHVARMALHQPFCHNSTYGRHAAHDASEAVKSLPTRSRGAAAEYLVTPAAVASIAFLKHASKQLDWPAGPLTTKTIINSLPQLRKARDLTRLFTHLNVPTEPYLGSSRSRMLNVLRNYGLFDIANQFETLFVNHENKLAGQAASGHYGDLTVDSFDLFRELRAANAVSIGNHRSVFVDALPPEAVVRYDPYPRAPYVDSAATATAAAPPATEAAAADLLVSEITGADVSPRSAAPATPHSFFSKQPDAPAAFSEPLYIPPTDADLSWVSTLMRGGLKLGVVAPVEGAKAVDPLATFANLEEKLEALAETDRRVAVGRQREKKRYIYPKSHERLILCRALTESNKFERRVREWVRESDLVE